MARDTRVITYSLGEREATFGTGILMNRYPRLEGYIFYSYMCSHVMTNVHARGKMRFSDGDVKMQSFMINMKRKAYSYSLYCDADKSCEIKLD